MYYKLKECNEKVLSLMKLKDILYCGLDNGYFYAYNGQFTKKLKSNTSSVSK